jgi:hypothetical protein
MKVQILNATGVMFQGAVSQAVLPGVGGELSILDDHEPIFVALKRGFVCLTPFARKFGVTAGGRSGGQFEELKPIKIQRGVARMKASNELVILVE